MASKNLGEILLERGVISPAALERALKLQGRRLGEILVEEHLADPIAVAQALKLQAQGREAQTPSGRRSIDSDRLEPLLIALERLEDALSPAAGASQEGPELGSRAGVDSRALSAVSHLRGGIEGLFLQDLRGLEQRIRAVVSRSQVDSGKAVKLEFECVDAAVDRLLVDDLADVLLHLVRNAVEHGTEPAEVRAVAGKPREGHIQVRISVKSSALRIEVRDDGPGVDEERVAEKARSLGLLPSDQKSMSAEDLARILFTPGFSTLSQANARAGRGVGLDCVEAAVLRFGGAVRVDSQRGVGTTFELEVPLWLGRLEVLPIRSAGEWVAVLSEQVIRVEKADDLAGPGDERGVLVHFSNGGTLLAEDVRPPQKAFVRRSSGLRAGGVVLGGAKVSDGRTMLWVDPALARSERV